jgi:hypothetical protein
MAGLISALVARDQAIPIRWKNYQPDKATVRLRFRWPEKSAALIEALGVSVVKDPAPTTT